MRHVTPTDHSIKKQKSAPRWHRMYYLLAGFDLIVVLTSLFLSHQILQIYNTSVDTNRQWTIRQDKNVELATLAGLVNAPGNDVFESHDVKAESKKMRVALGVFNKHVESFKQDLSLQISARNPSQLPVQQTIETLPQDLTAIQTSMNEMTAEAELIFSYFEENQSERAGHRMATMDQKYAKVLSAVGRMREHIREIQDKLFQQELDSADSLRRFDYVIALFVMLMVSGALIYGHKIKTRMEAVTSENENHLQDLEREIAERREAEKARSESERKLSLHIQKTPLAAIEINEKGEIIEWNPAAETIFGYSSAEVIGKSVFGILVPDTATEQVEQVWQDLLSKKGGWRTTNENLTKDGGIIICDWYNTSLESNGKVIGVASLGQDITERTRMEIELAQAHEKALESARLKSEFLANMSHEIRTPMNGVIGMTGLLLDTELNADQRDFAETIRSSGDALLTIINDILDFSKIEAGKLEFHLVDFDLRDAVEETMELLSEMARKKNLEFASLVHAEVPTALRGDSGRLRQVLTNLIGNALKFTEEGEVVVLCEKVKEDGLSVTIRFAVRDTGIGINESTQAKLFQAFTQADGSMTRKYGGTGLGLSISKQLVHMMSGEIGVSSVPGQGTEFWFTAVLEKQTEMPRFSESGRSLKSLRALIVDDNQTNRKILAHQLNAWGVFNDGVASGPEALEALSVGVTNHSPYDLVLLDYQMPGMDGLELANCIQTDSRFASTKLIMLSSCPREHAAKALAAGVTIYLTKPVRQAQLFDCLTSLMPSSVRMNNSTAADSVRPELIRTASQKRILVAEDNAVNQKVAIRQLKKLGYHADAVSNGREAIGALANASYDLVLMDCQMPEMDGYEATLEIRRSEGNAQRIPIIAMTAHAMVEDKERSLVAGMDDHINKPVKVENLASVLTKYLGGPTTPFYPPQADRLSPGELR
jgi:two-component system sensor histidine kinase/response regulator